jgi:hypothetical protein
LQPPQRIDCQFVKLTRYGRITLTTINADNKLSVLAPARSRRVKRLAVLRETRLFPAQQAEEARARAEELITRARQEAERLTADSPRLIAAIQRQQQVADAAAERSAGRHCKDRCIRESDRQIELAAAEVANASQELDHKRANAAAELREAVNALAAIPPARPVSALANWLGVDPRTTVIVQSTTISVAVLVLAIGLLHLGGRGPVPVAQSARDETAGEPPHTTPGIADESRRLIAQEPRVPHGPYRVSSNEANQPGHMP